MAHKIAWHDFKKIGGPDDIVEVDETHLFKRKNNVGHLAAPEVRNIWFVGGISRKTGLVFGKIVHRRSANDLIPILEEHIYRDTFVCTDEWAAYNQVGATFAGHGKVKHKRNFTNPPSHRTPFYVPPGRFHANCLDQNWPRHRWPANGHEPYRVHTNTIESNWRGLKSVLGKATREPLAEKYTSEWMYRKNIPSAHKDNDGVGFRRFLNDVRRAYPGLAKRAMTDDMATCQCHECAP